MEGMIHSATETLEKELTDQWQVAYYGLAAAGVICLALLNNDLTSSNTSPAESIRNLSVLAAGIDAGALVQIEDPSYALLSRAARTISNLLDRLIADKFAAPLPNDEAIPPNASLPPFLAEEGQTWAICGLQDFDPTFWQNLSEHLFLTAPDDASNLL